MPAGNSAQKTSPQPRFSEQTRAIGTVALLVAGIVALYISYAASALGYISQWLIAIILLMSVGILISSLNGFTGGYGIYLLSTKKGIGFVDRLAKSHERFWKAMSMWGLVLGLGLLSYPFVRGKIDKKLFIFSALCILFIMVVVLPFTLSGFQFINIPQLQSAVQSAQPAPQATAQIIAYLLYGVAVAVGLTGFIMLLLLENAVSILVKIGAFVASAATGPAQASALQGIVPGVAPLIPGIDIPLVAGLVSLAVLLVVHELSHGVLARIAKVRLRSVGLMMFGIIPIGAFVEPDEKQVMKLDATKQNRIIAAGTSANFIMMFVFFILLWLLLAYVIPGIYVNKILVTSTVQGLPAYGMLEPGMQILYWNGHSTNNVSALDAAGANVTPGSKVTVVTNNGTFAFTAVSVDNSTRGYIGIEAEQVYVPAQNNAYSQLVQFLYSLFSLSLLFNFSVAVINLLPIPVFDGWRLYKINLKDQRITKALAIFVIVLLLINALSWLLLPFAA